MLPMKRTRNKFIIYKYFTILLVLLSVANSKADVLDPVKWQFASKQTAPNEFDLIFTATIGSEWHMYSQFSDQSNDAPVNLSFTFKPGAYTTVGNVKEISKVIVEFDKVVGHDLKFFKGKAEFIQHVKINAKQTNIAGTLNFMVCRNGACLPPKDVDFNFALNNNSSTSAATAPIVTAPENTMPDKSNVEQDKNDTLSADKTRKVKSEEKIDAPKFNTVADGNISKLSLWKIFFLGLVSGFVALLTPCVFPMIPLTVSFFTKKKKSKTEGIQKAILFGISIIVIYVALGLLITLIFGSNTLNSISSNAWVNLGFFVIFLVFAISFLGAFEINLPSSWTNNSDKMSERSGFVGIFFMAFTLALVSFSCTGPVVGQLLVLTGNGGSFAGPIVGMTGFSFAMALPFTIFAAFPTLMHNLPRSGGWLNSVKVTLGFIELALALKFLSAADLINDWGLLKREYFLALWIVIFFLLGLYLLGKLMFSHDTATHHISVTRLLLAIVAFAFTAYMIPGLWGAPVNILSGIAPPNEYNEGPWINNSLNAGIAQNNTETSKTKTKKYEAYFKNKTPLGLDAYYDYQEALAEARRVKKPLMIDFTGIVCTNCRKMENTIWANPGILKRLKENVVLVSLFMDDKHQLDSNEVYISKRSSQKITTIGDKWNDFAATVFNSNSEPYYILLDQNEKLLVEPMGYDPDPSKFANFLDNGKTEYQHRQ